MILKKYTTSRDCLKSLEKWSTYDGHTQLACIFLKYTSWVILTKLGVLLPTLKDINYLTVLFISMLILCSVRYIYMIKN